jgi:hypothetical protein
MDYPIADSQEVIWTFRTGFYCFVPCSVSTMSLSPGWQFKNAQGKIIQEKSQLLILLYPFKENGQSQKVEQIRQVYKTAFQQESVLRVDSISCVSF